MARRQSSRASLARSAEPLYREIRAVLESARAGAYRAVNTAMVLAYWNVGRLIVEHEQGGRKRAAYGEAVLNTLSRRLMAEFGHGFDVTNLRKMRQFHPMFEIRDAVRLESGEVKRDPPRLVFGKEPIRHMACGGLSWSHYRLLMQVENPAAREWYMREAVDQNWSTRQLDRQISVLFYERLLTSRRKAPVRKEAAAKLVAVEPEQFIRDPYLLEFLDLKDYPALRESTVEQAIIDNLQGFLLELGKGFSFVARQKRLRFEDEDFYVDLVFYKYLLKCFVLIDLKAGRLTHQDIGQMDSYVRMFDVHVRSTGWPVMLPSTRCTRTWRHRLLGRSIPALPGLPQDSAVGDSRIGTRRQRYLVWHAPIRHPAWWQGGSFSWLFRFITQCVVNRVPDRSRRPELLHRC